MCKAVDNYVQACVYQGKQEGFMEGKTSVLEQLSGLMKQGLTVEEIYEKLISE